MFSQEEISDLEKAVKILMDGGIILYPTDTIWGLGCDATNQLAVKRLFEIKNRPDSKAMISLVDSIESLKKWVENIPQIALDLIEKSIRPLTVIYDFPRDVDRRLIAEDGSAAFRIPYTSPFAIELCRRLEKPLVSTSVNISGKDSPHFFSEIDPAIIEKADYCCSSGRNQTNTKPSKIIKVTGNNNITIIRG